MTPHRPPWPNVLITLRTWSSLVKSASKACTCVLRMSSSVGFSGKCCLAICSTRLIDVGNELWELSIVATRYLRVKRSESTVWEPMYPAPPVMRTFYKISNVRIGCPIAWYTFAPWAKRQLEQALGFHLPLERRSWYDQRLRGRSARCFLGSCSSRLLPGSSFVKREK